MAHKQAAASEAAEAEAKRTEAATRLAVAEAEARMRNETVVSAETAARLAEAEAVRWKVRSRPIAPRKLILMAYTRKPSVLLFFLHLHSHTHTYSYTPCNVPDASQTELEVLQRNGGGIGGLEAATSSLADAASLLAQTRNETVSRGLQLEGKINELEVALSVSREGGGETLSTA